MTEHKLLKIQFPLLLEGNLIPGAKQLKYKQTSTTSEQIWLRIWSLKMSPVTTGCWRQPTKSRAPLFLQSPAFTTRPPLTDWPLFCSRNSYSGLTRSCQRPVAVVILYLLQVILLPSAQPARNWQFLSACSWKQQDAESHLISELEQILFAVQETQPEFERLKALMSRKCQTINLSPARQQMEKEIQYTRSNLSINYGPLYGCQGLLKC